jgi:hypothetical protein
MEIISAIVLVLSPVVVMGITQLVKSFRAVDKIPADLRAPLLRAVVLVFSLGATVAKSLIDGTEVDTSVIQQVAEAIVLFLATTGTYMWAKK